MKPFLTPEQAQVIFEQAWRSISSQYLHHFDVYQIVSRQLMRAIDKLTIEQKGTKEEMK